MFRKWYHNRIKKVVDERLANLLNGELKYLNLHSINDRNENDIYIVGYPRSGTTLMQHLVAHLYFGLNANAQRLLINVAVPGIHGHKYYPRISPVSFFKSHSLPDPSYRKVIYLVRDGRDANLSLFHYHRELIGDSIEIEEVFLSPSDFGTWGQHVLEWHSNPHKADILFIHYEDLINDKLSVIRKVNDFIGAGVGESQFEQVKKMTSMEHMKNLEKTEHGILYKKKINWKVEGEFSRSGKTEVYKEEVPLPVIEAFNKSSEEALKLFGYPVNNPDYP